MEGAKHPFLIWTDHRNLTYIKRLNSRQARWTLFFNRFDFVLSYCPGSRNTKPDALSRQFVAPEDESRQEPILPTSRVIAAIQWGVEAVVKRALRQQLVPGNCPPGRFFVPNQLRFDVLQWKRSALPSGHPGANRTYRVVRRRFCHCLYCMWPEQGGPTLHWPL